MKLNFLQYKKKNLLILKILIFLYLKTIFEIAENVHEKESDLNVTKKEKKESNSLEKKNKKNQQKIISEKLSFNDNE